MVLKSQISNLQKLEATQGRASILFCFALIGYVMDLQRKVILALLPRVTWLIFMSSCLLSLLSLHEIMENALPTESSSTLSVYQVTNIPIRDKVDEEPIPYYELPRNGKFCLVNMEMWSVLDATFHQNSFQSMSVFPLE